MYTGTIILIRHGRTESNALGRYCGVRTDEGLSKEGIRECNEKRESILRIIRDESAPVFSGPLKRAKETASLLFPRVPVRTIEKLTETDFGEFEGKTFRQLASDQGYQDWVDSGGTLPFPGGDARSDFIGRSMEGFREFVRLSKGAKESVVVCHGGNIMAVMSSLTGEEYYDFRVENLGGYVIKIREDDERISVISYDRIDCGCDT